MYIPQWGANGPGIVPVTGLRTRLGRDLASKPNDRPANRPYKTANCLQRFLHTHTHTLWLLLFIRFTLLFILFHILYLTARLDSTTCFNFAQFFQHNNRFNRIFNCSSIGRTNAHTAGRSETRDPRPFGNPSRFMFYFFFFLFFHITARACAFWGALFP